MNNDNSYIYPVSVENVDHNNTIKEISEFSYTNTNSQLSLVTVGFASQFKEPTDQEVYDMVDDAILHPLEPKELASIIR